VVALLGFLQQGQMLFEFLRAFPGGPVNALELLAFLISTPVGAGYGQQFERWDLAGRFHMGAGAQVLEIAVAIRGYCFVFGNAFDDLQFERLV
jgi:hypothetical protein